MPQSWVHLLRLADDVLADEVMVLPGGAMPSPRCGGEELADRLTLHAGLHAAAREQFPRLIDALSEAVHTCGLADPDGVVLTVLIPPAGSCTCQWRVEGSRLFEAGGAARSAIRAGRVVVMEPAGGTRCEVFVPIRLRATSTLGILALECEAAALTPHVAVIIGQTARLIAALTRVEQMRQHHDRALAMVAHELRQPLSALMTALKLLERTSSHHLPRKAYDVAERQAAQLGGLVESLLDLSRLLTGKMRITRRLADLRRILTAAVESVRADIDAAGVRLDVTLPGAPVWCNGDPARLQEVAVNLLTNAMRHTPARGTIAVALQGGETITLTVADTGEGIARGMEERIFQPFMQNSAGEGLGLGLPISLAIVQMHGGRINVESRGEGMGSRFTVRLPGVLERTRQVHAAVSRTREDSMHLVEHSRVLRGAMPLRPGGS